MKLVVYLSGNILFLFFFIHIFDGILIRIKIYHLYPFLYISHTVSPTGQNNQCNKCLNLINSYYFSWLLVITALVGAFAMLFTMNFFRLQKDNKKKAISWSKISREQRHLADIYMHYYLKRVTKYITISNYFS